MRFKLVWSSGAIACGLGLIASVYAEEPSNKELIDLALSAAPPSISNDATVLVPGKDGNFVEAKKGTNGFTCLPDIPETPKPDPMCLDPAATQWAMSLLKGEAKPSNTVPGIGYMGRGGQHWEKDGKMFMTEQPGAKIVDEPPHWMVFWPFDSKTTALPQTHTHQAYIMFEGTPYAHLMIYQDPKEVIGH
jgi:hypothetical protein